MFTFLRLMALVTLLLYTGCASLREVTDDYEWAPAKQVEAPGRFR